MATNPDVAAILAALQGVPNPASFAPQQQYSAVSIAQQPGAPAQAPPGQPPLPPGSVPAPAYTGVIPTPPPQNYAPYGLPQPTASGNIDLSSIKPVGHGNVNFQDALSKVQGFAAAHGVPPPGSAPPRQDPRLAGRPLNYRSRSRSPSQNYNPYRDERRDDPRRHNGYGRDRSRSPSRGTRNNFSPQRDRDHGHDDPDSEVIAIESNLVGLVIGRGGDNLKRIERETGARIQFITGPQHNGPQRECRLSGSVRNRMDAKNAIWRILDENGGHGTALKSQVTPSNANKPRAGAGASPGAGAVAGAGMISNQPKLREGEDSVQIMVPDKTVGLIIGRGGETIRDLQEKSQCHINIVGENKSVNGLRPVNLIGSAQAAQRARELILEIVDSDTRNQELAAGGRQPQPDRSIGSAQPDKITETIRVPSDSVGMIIGKGGETIKEMQSQTGCKINVHQAAGRDVERPIDLVGDRGAIERARAAIWDKVEQVKEKNRSNQDGRSQSRDDNRQQYGANSYTQPQQYAQQSVPGQAAPQAQADPSDPYAPYGGYANYVKMWAEYQAQQGAAGAAQQPPA